MKKITYILVLLCGISFAQTEEERIEAIKNELSLLSQNTTGLAENIKTEIQVTNISLTNLLIAVSEVHKINIHSDPQLNQIIIANNFPNVTVADLLVFLCKEYKLTIEFTSNILAVKPYVIPPKEKVERVIPINYDTNSSFISIDAQGDKLSDVFKRISNMSGKRLVYAPGLENKLITFYIQNTSFDAAMEKLAFANNLYLEKTKDDFYQFESNEVSASSKQTLRQRPRRIRNSNFFFKVLNIQEKLLEVDFENTAIADIIYDIGNELNINIFTAAPLEEAGNTTFKAKKISFDDLLSKIFETQVKTAITGTTSDNNENQNQSGFNQNTTSESSKKFSFKNENNIYYFGTEDQLSVRKVEIISLRHRSIELLADPSGSQNQNNFGRQSFGGSSSLNNNLSRNTNNNQFNTSNNRRNSNQNFSSPDNQGNSNNGLSNRSLLDIVSDEIKASLDIKVDYELNSFYVTGAATDIKRFKEFIDKIDKPVPVILIEVMIVEVIKNYTTETGVTWGIGSTPAVTQGSIFPTTNLTLGATTINRIIGSFNDFGGFNIGKVIPDFFATIRAMESEGNLKIRSTPKLATLNGHRATFSSGQTSFFQITDQAVIGSDNPVTQTAVTFESVDAELELSVKPSVSSDGQILLDINVIQSNFGDRITENAPPDINSREFSSIIRMQDQDIAILGGLEEQRKDDSGTGIPLLSRIPVIKWLFSSRRREVSKSKLTVLIKPTVIY